MGSVVVLSSMMILFSQNLRKVSAKFAKKRKANIMNVTTLYLIKVIYQYMLKSAITTVIVNKHIMLIFQFISVWKN